MPEIVAMRMMKDWVVLLVMAEGEVEILPVMKLMLVIVMDSDYCLEYE